MTAIFSVRDKNVPSKLRSMIAENPYLEFMESLLHMDKLDTLFPYIAEQFGLDKRINLHFQNKTYMSDETVDTIQQSNIITLKKDAIELLTTL